ncbi:uncharacterized protein EV154DRAFT_564035 [Mucor mucedo]|uniref:uncharacterized protein n=1 Tax=Mucor mucedo TaxID=29922 RepID=UPI00222040A5|nr:uncharacterized protein EV154DRAFT_564035 [Mucor mucedo]KAI7890760.1 hypothetical protein EV154DRAFT_564035 [Mucor mucedo]
MNPITQNQKFLDQFLVESPPSSPPQTLSETPPLPPILLGGGTTTLLMATPILDPLNQPDQIELLECLYKTQKRVQRLINKQISKVAKLTHKNIKKDGFSILYNKEYQEAHRSVFTSKKMIEKVSQKAQQFHNQTPKQTARIHKQKYQPKSQPNSIHYIPRKGPKPSANNKP